MLVPLDIAHKTFKKSVSGYSTQEVEEFLDQVEKDFATLYRENKELTEKVAKLNEEVNRFRATGNQIQSALTLAQKTADDLKESAKKEAELIVIDARQKSEKIITDSNLNVRSIKNAFLEFKGEFRAYLTTFLNLLDNMDVSLSTKSQLKEERLEDDSSPKLL
jgi:cell division initiation protein